MAETYTIRAKKENGKPAQEQKIDLTRQEQKLGRSFGTLVRNVLNKSSALYILLRRAQQKSRLSFLRKCLELDKDRDYYTCVMPMEKSDMETTNSTYRGIVDVLISASTEVKQSGERVLRSVKYEGPLNDVTKSYVNLKSRRNPRSRNHMRTLAVDLNTLCDRHCVALCKVYDYTEPPSVVFSEALFDGVAVNVQDGVHDTIKVRNNKSIPPREIDSRGIRLPVNIHKNAKPWELLERK